MKKIPTMFARDWEGDRRYVRAEVTPGCEWVIAGEGTPTRKYDGTCVMFDGDRWWARREVKAGKAAPAAWLHARPFEGIVWHRPDGSMAKIKNRDFPPPARS